MEQIRAEHEQLGQNMDELQKQLQTVTARRVYLEGAFNELQAMLEEETGNVDDGTIEDATDKASKK